MHSIVFGTCCRRYIQQLDFPFPRLVRLIHDEDEPKCLRSDSDHVANRGPRAFCFVLCFISTVKIVKGVFSRNFCLLRAAVDSTAPSNHNEGKPLLFLVKGWKHDPNGPSSTSTKRIFRCNPKTKANDNQVRRKLPTFSASMRKRKLLRRNLVEKCRLDLSKATPQH